LIIGKAEAGKIEVEPGALDLSAFCRELVEDIQISAASSHVINFVSVGQCHCSYMDEKLLRHIFSNLLSNAVKYSPQGGTVDFQLACQNGEAIFTVLDSGIGIPPEEQPHLFDSFHRAKNVGTIPGTGLGLAIVKNCVELHGGTIAVKSELGSGTTVKVTIPLNYQARENKTRE
jgi:signal transduction histidine kinase